jgi:hypothetical protein
MGNQSISDNEREKVLRRLRKGSTDSSEKIAAEIGLRERSVAGVKSWYKQGRYSRKRRMPRAQRSKRYNFNGSQSL